MLKTRVMPTVLYRGMGIVKGVGFDSWRPVGSLMQAIKVYNLRDVDELVFLDITATLEDRPPDLDLVDDFADECFMPLSIGGGVRHADDVGRLLDVGADKIVINTSAVQDPGVIGAIASRYGSQCVVVSIDARRGDDGSAEVFTHAGTVATGLDPADLARRAADTGAGEILITSIDRDGTMKGYDVDLTRSVVEAVSVPVIASGGAGSYEDMHAVLTDGGASAVAAASIFHFTEQTPREAKRYLADRGIPVRL